MLDAVSLIIRVGAVGISELFSQIYCLGDGVMAYATNVSNHRPVFFYPSFLQPRPWIPFRFHGG